MRIAYLCDLSPLDRNLYSGGNARMYDALCSHVGEVTILSQSWHLAEPVRRFIQNLPEAANLRLRWRAQYALAPVIARGIAAELARTEYDVVFGAYSLQALDRLRVPSTKVTAFTSDAVQTVYRDSEIGQAFDSKFRGGRRLDGWVEARERATLRKTDVLLWPSDWLKTATEDRYGIAPARSHHVPWGANIEPPPDPPNRSISPDAPLRLLLVGRDWFAKGGPVAFDTMMALRESGVDARLTVIGGVPPDHHQNEWVTVLAELNKAVPEDLARFEAAFAEAHFMVQPSFESFGFAFCEASAHGLPALCLRVGGVPIVDDVNGQALPLGSGPADFAEVIRGYLGRPDDYAALCTSARRYYRRHLNWDAWGKAVGNLLRDAVAAKAQRA